jgi:hypothetical protein
VQTYNFIPIYPKGAYGKFCPEPGFVGLRDLRIDV